MKFQLLIAGCLLACAFSAPVNNVEFDEDCVEEMNEPLEIDSESIQMPKIEAEKAIAAPEEFLMYDELETFEDDCEEELEPSPAPITADYQEEADYECEEEENTDFISEVDYDANAFAYDQGSMVIEAHAEDIIDEECEEVTAEAFAEDFGFHIEAAGVEEAEAMMMEPIEEENFADEIEECED